MATPKRIEDYIAYAEEFIKQEANKKKAFTQIDNRHSISISRISITGSQDGKKNIPKSSDARPTTSEQKIKTDYEAQLISILNGGLILLNKLNDGPLKNIMHRRKSEDYERKQIEDAELGKINNSKVEEEERYKYEKEAFEKKLSDLNEDKLNTENNYQAKVSETGREMPKHWNEYVCWTIIMILAFVEVPLNSKIFEFFKLGRIETYITSGILIISFPILSHFAGLALHKQSTGKPNLKAAIPVFGFIVLLCLVINIFRVDFIDRSNNEANLYQGLSIGSIMSTTSFWMAFLINIAMFICGIILSYNMHDQDIEFENAYNLYKKHMPKLESEMVQIHEDITGAAKKHRQKLASYNAEIVNVKKNADNHIKKLREDYNILASHYDSMIHHMISIQEYVNAKYHSALLHYRSQNQIHRKDSNPEYWDQEIMDLEDLIAARGFHELNPQEKEAGFYSESKGSPVNSPIIATPLTESPVVNIVDDSKIENTDVVSVNSINNKP